MPHLPSRPFARLALVAAIAVGPASAAPGMPLLATTAISAPTVADGGAPRRGGKVRLAWPKRRRGKPRGMLGRWLAKQVGSGGPVPASRRLASPLLRGERGEALVFAPVTASAPLELVRSFDIPADDPSYERLLNFSWTYDSALAAVAFAARGERREAEQLLSQLAALQRTDGSLEYGWDTDTGAGVPLFRSGSLAAVGLATVQFRRSFGNRRYDEMAMLAARWLLAQQEEDAAQPAAGLLYGGPDADWMSTQHNILAYFFLRRLYEATADDLEGVIPIFECVYDDAEGVTHAVFGYDNRNPYQVAFPAFATNHLSPTTVDGPQPVTFEPGRHYAVFEVPMPSGSEGNVVWHLHTQKDVARRRGPACADDLAVAPPPAGPGLSDLADAAERIARGIERVLLVEDESGLHLIQGHDDPVLPLDTQALGILFLLDRGNVEGAGRLEQYLLARYLVPGRTIVHSAADETYNMRYAAPGPFLGFRPYADASSPDVLWMEGTGEARFALTVLGGATDALDGSIEEWRTVTTPARQGLLGADRTCFDPDFNEYHVWPTSAATSWYLLSRTDPAATIFVTAP